VKSFDRERLRGALNAASSHASDPLRPAAARLQPDANFPTLS
jgi:hypothetical protein